MAWRLSDVRQKFYNIIKTDVVENLLVDIDSKKQKSLTIMIFKKFGENDSSEWKYSVVIRIKQKDYLNEGYD